MQILDVSHRRVTETPNATMTTLASPTLGGAATSMWLVEMRPGAEGPVHAFDADLVWSITAGDGLVRQDGDERPIASGDTLVLPAGRMRQLVAGPSGLTAVVSGRGGSAVRRAEGGPAEVPPWVA